MCDMPIKFQNADISAIIQELGRWGLALLEQGLESYGLALFTRHLEMSPEEANRLSKGAFEECSRPGVHAYLSQYVPRFHEQTAS